MQSRKYKYVSKKTSLTEKIDNQETFIVGGTLSLIGPSPGGWRTRVYMEEFQLSHISLLLTLGIRTCIYNLICKFCFSSLWIPSIFVLFPILET